MQPLGRVSLGGARSPGLAGTAAAPGRLSSCAGPFPLAQHTPLSDLLLLWHPRAWQEAWSGGWAGGGDSTFNTTLRAWPCAARSSLV